MSSQVEEVAQTTSQHHPVSEAKMIEQRKTPSSSVAGTPPNLQRQTSSASNSHAGTPVQTVTTYLKNLLGLSAKPTKRTLSEEAECGSPDSLREWLRTGSDPNEVDPYGYTPLVNACLRGCKKSATVLIANGADPNMKAMHGYTPLHAAAQNGYYELVELLLDHGANVEAKNDDGDTPLMLAVRSDHPEVVDALCKRGCDMHTHGFDNIEPMDYALSKRNLYLSDVLMKHERQHGHVHHTSPLATSAVPPSPTSATSQTTATTITASPTTAIDAPNSATANVDAQTRRSLTGMLIEQQEAHLAAAQSASHKVLLERLDSEPDQETPNSSNSAAEPIFQAE